MKPILLLIIGGSVVLAQYGPPKQTGPKKHRTTTTESPNDANEVVPTPYYESGSLPGGGTYELKANSISQPGLSVMSHSYSYTGPGVPQTPIVNQPYPQSGCGGNGYGGSCAPQGQQPIDISKNPFINAGLSGTPVTSKPSYAPQPQPQPKPPQGQPSNPFLPQNFKPQQPQQPQPIPSYPQQPAPPRPQQPSYPSQQPQPSYPSQPQQPQPLPPKPVPSYPQPIPQQPSYPSQPQPLPPKPVPSYPQPIPQQPSYPSQPQQPQPLPPKPVPSYPQPIPQQPSYPSQPQPLPPKPVPSYPQPIPQQPSYPSQPQQPQPLPPKPVPSYPQPIPQQPQQPSYPQGGQQPLPFPNPSKPQTGYQPLPNPQRPPPSNPGNPFLSGSVPVPKSPNCNGDHLFCVPQNACNNGLIIDKSTQPELKYGKGQCNAGEVCCKASYSGQPIPNYVTEAPQQKYTGPLNTTPPPGCAAALKCVQEIYCTVEGVMSDTPVVLTRDQTENKVPLTDCQDPDTGVLGKCCRDPNYKDPWPAGMMMMNTGFDDGQYHPDKYPGGAPAVQNPPPNPFYSQPTLGPQVFHTIKHPLGAFQTAVTPFPVVAPKPGQTHSQVFPQNEDKVLQTLQPGGPPVQRPDLSLYRPVQTSPVIPGSTTSQGYQPSPPPQPLPQPSPSSYPEPAQPQPQYQPQPQPQQPQQQYQPQPQPRPQQPQQQYQPQPQPQPQQPQQQYQPQPQPRPQQPQQQYQPQPQPQPQQPQQQYQPQPQPQPQPSPSNPPVTSPNENSIKPGEECGVRRPVPPTKPDETGFGEFPWHVVILAASNRSAICSGAIIAPNAVLTAAHCIDGIKPEDMVIKAGEWALGQPGEKPIQMRVVAASAIHPVYSSGSLVKDQAVIVTEKPFNFDQHIDKVCLPASGSSVYTPQTTTCFLTGWGRPTLEYNEPGSILHKVPITVIPKNECENSLKKTHLGKYFILNEGFTCAVPPSEKDLCKVDVGSPLVCERPDGHYELAGVYSWDTKCSSSLPGIMATCDTDWINQILATPLETLKQQAAQPQITHLPEDIDSKPGFALGYGK